MGDIVAILKDKNGKRIVEGKAEIIQVLTYLGGGLYMVQCVFVDDKDRKIHVRLYNIDEPVPGVGVK